MNSLEFQGEELLPIVIIVILVFDATVKEETEKGFIWFYKLFPSAT